MPFFVEPVDSPADRHVRRAWAAEQRRRIARERRLMRALMALSWVTSGASGIVLFTQAGAVGALLSVVLAVNGALFAWQLHTLHILNSLARRLSWERSL